MRNVIVILVISVYLSLSVGFNVLLHTCGDRANAYMLPISVDDPCENDGSHQCCAEEPCCRLELKVFHLDDSQLQPLISQNDNIIMKGAVCSDLISYNSLDGHPLPVIPVDSSPPLNNPLHIIYCSLLI